MASLPINSFVDVTYTITPQSAPRRGFNLGLIMGTSSVISTSTRVQKFSSLEEMIDAGFTNVMPEYLAAQLYFSATSQPREVLIGRIGTGETVLQAVQDARVKNTEWYVLTLTTGSNNDIKAVAGYTEASSIYFVFFAQSADANVKNNVSGNLFEELKDLNYRRTLPFFSTVNYAASGLSGYAMGQTSNLANSAYTLKFKTLPGVTVDDLTTQQVNNIEGNNGNVYVNRGDFFAMFEQGTMANGVFFDEVIYLDKLANDAQLNIADVLYQLPKVAQTEDGIALLRQCCARSGEKLKKIGFIAPGKWNGANILPLPNNEGYALNTGDYLPLGYDVLSEAIDAQDQADREARIAPPIYMPIKLAGAVHSVIVQIDVNR